MTAHNLESRRSRRKLENSYVVRCGVRYAYGISSPFFFNEWLEKHGIIGSRSPNCNDSLRNLIVSGFFRCSMMIITACTPTTPILMTSNLPYRALILPYKALVMSEVCMRFQKNVWNLMKWSINGKCIVSNLKILICASGQVCTPFSLHVWTKSFLRCAWGLWHVKYVGGGVFQNRMHTWPCKIPHAHLPTSDGYC